MQRRNEAPKSTSTPSKTDGAPWHRVSGSLTAVVRGAIVASWALGLVAVLGTLVPGREARPASLPGMVIVGFLAAGAGLHFAAARRTAPAVVLGALVAASGPFLLVENSFLGGVETLREAVSVAIRALCLLLSGAAITLLSVGTERRAGAVVAGFLGAVTIALGLGELSGFLFLIEDHLVGDAGSSILALWASGGLAVLGAGTLALACRESGLALGARAPRWLAMAVAMFLATGALGLWQSMRAAEERRLGGLLDREEVAVVTARVEERLERLMLALVRMGKRWEQAGGTPQAEWEVDAAYYLKHETGYQAIGWVDSSWVVQWIVPFAGSGKRLGASLAAGQILRPSIRLPAEQVEPLLSPLTELGTGGEGYLLFVPVRVEGRPNGLIVGELRVDQMLHPILDEASSRGVSTVVLDGEALVAGQPADASGLETWAREVTIPVVNRSWRIRVVPTSGRLRQEATVVPGLTLAVSLALAGLVGVAIERSGAARHRERKFRTFLEAAPHAWFAVDAGGRIVHTNARAEEWLGYRREELIGGPVEILVPERFRAEHPEHREEYSRNPVQRPMSAGRVLFVRRKDGSEVPVEISLSPVVTDDGFLVLTAIVDVSHRVKLGQELRSMNAKLESQVAERTAALEQRARELERANAELERFNRLAVGREHRMIDLKRQVNELAVRLEDEPRYDLSFATEE